MPQLLLVLVFEAAGYVFLLLFLHSSGLIPTVLFTLGAIAAALVYRRVPAVLRPVSNAFRRWSTVAYTGLLLLALAFPLFSRSSPYWMFVLTMLGLNLIVALGLNIHMGTAGLSNFAGAALFGAGAYTASILAVRLGWPAWADVIVGTITVVVLSALLFVPVVKLRGHYLALVTIAFGQVFTIALNNVMALGGPTGIRNVPGLSLGAFQFNQDTVLTGLGRFHFYSNYYILMVILVALALVLVYRFYNSPVGLLINSTRGDEWATKTAGVNVARWKLLAVCLGAGMIGFAGTVFAHLLGNVAPTDFTLNDSLFTVSILILGGMDSIAGVSLATLLLVVSTEKLQVIEEYRFLIYSLAVVAMLIFRPQGLVPAAVRRYFPGLHPQLRQQRPDREMVP